MDETHERLEAHLRSEEPSIADDGFSEAVLARLPARRFRARTARCLSYALAGAIGSVLTLLSVSPEIFPVETIMAVAARFGAITASLLISIAVIGMLIVPIAWLVYGEMSALPRVSRKRVGH